MSFQALLKAAEQLQQRGERRRGAEAAQLYAQAVAKYKEALASSGGGAPPSATDHAACLFGLAESLQEGAEAVVAATAQLSDNALTAQAVQQADSQAAALLAESVAAYQRVREPDGQPRVDALVCAGNALSAWAEVAARHDPAQAEQLLRQAAGSYQAALGREEDALTWSNLADCLVQRGELLCEAGQGQAGGEAFSEAMAAYQRACGLSDASEGDDLPGLLINWARGLLAMAQQAQDASLALQLLEEAARRLGQAIDFQRGSEEPLVALGDVLLERGEQLAAAGQAQAAAESLQRALVEGYQQAQRIRAQSAEAAVGTADVHVQLARLAAAAAGPDPSAAQAAAAQHWAAADAGYRAALQQPTAFDLRERCDVRYNLACVLVQRGQRDEAAALLRPLLALGAVSAADVAADADLAGVAL